MENNMTSVPNDSGNPQEELKPKNTKAMIILVTIIVIIIIGAVIAVVLKLNKTDTTTSNFLATADSVTFNYEMLNKSATNLKPTQKHPWFSQIDD